MKTTQSIPGCKSCPMNRREFLAKGSAAAAGAMCALTMPAWAEPPASIGRTRIHIIYSLHGEIQNIPDWPNKGFDFRPAMDLITRTLAEECKGFQFITSLASGPEQAKAILKKDKRAKIDGYLVVQMNCWNQVVQTIASSGKPVLYADFQFAGSGGFLKYTAEFLRKETRNVGFIASSSIAELVEAVKCFDIVKKGRGVSAFVAATVRVRTANTPKSGSLEPAADNVVCISSEECLRRFKESKILAVLGQNSGPGGEVMGIPVTYVPFAELNDAWEKADKDEAKTVAERWRQRAKTVEGVSLETLETSASMYLAEKAVMAKHNANGITINCLGGFYGGHIHAYPCIGFHQLLNEGLVGGCECDVRSTATMVAVSTLTQGRPGYISDPVIDTARRQIIYAHCVASNRAFGPKGEENPYEILTHSEDRQGASIRSVLPTGYLTTTLECDKDRKEILFHQATVVGNDPDDRACRTKLCAEPVGDIEKLFTAWDQWGWHRVTVYGDIKEPVHGLADALGWKVVEEA